MTIEFPGFIDVHVHFRDPGMTNAETIRSGLLTASHSGFSAVVTMPNTAPACDSVDMLEYQVCTAKKEGLKTRLFPSACITSSRMGAKVACLEELAENGAAFFTDDGSYVSDTKVMEEAMKRIAKLGMVVCQHAMDPIKLSNGVIRNCTLAKKLGLNIIPVETETVAIKRDISLCRVTGCRLHIQHISTAEGVELVREAQREGLMVTAEATPHHLLLSCDEISSDDANFKMAPPLGNNEDRAELRRAVKDGVLMFATDHAPHPKEKKSQGFATSANGIIGLDTAIPITYKVMVEEEGMAIDDWARAWWKMPSDIISEYYKEVIASLPKTRVEIGEGKKFNLNESFSLSRNCPYDGYIFNCWPKEITEER